MDKNYDLLTVLIGAIIFTFLFNDESLGLNLLLFEILFSVWAYFRFKPRIKTTIGIVLISGFLVSSIFTIITHSVFTYTINFIAFFIVSGWLIYPQAKSILTSMAIAVFNIFQSQIKFISGIINESTLGKNTTSVLWRFRIFIIPVFVIGIFVTMYRISNPVFNSLAVKINSVMVTTITDLFLLINFPLVFTFLLGLIICSFLVFQSKRNRLVLSDELGSDVLERKRKKKMNPSLLLNLKSEYRAAIFLLIILNIIILILNSIDVYWVWFNFEWQGQYLKQFVHSGTYLLILSVLISIGLVLYFFRANLNFYSQNKLLKHLSYAWLMQNAILCISVAIRNIYYINTFSLAYKRIGVFIFLILTIYGLYTVFVKVSSAKTSFYLFRKNLLFIYLVLISFSVFNWDNIIAKYNFSHANTSFIHLDFLAELSDHSLPYLDKSLDELKAIEQIQNDKFSFEMKYMTSRQYFEKISDRKRKFKEQWEQKSWLSWNYPEAMAYKNLFPD